VVKYVISSNVFLLAVSLTAPENGLLIKAENAISDAIVAAIVSGAPILTAYFDTRGVTICDEIPANAFANIIIMKSLFHIRAVGCERSVFMII